MSKRWIAILAATLALLFGGAGLSQQTLAQDASTPSGEAAADHPAHIHSGTCAELGDVVFPLNNLTSGGAMATPEGGMEMGTPADSSMMSHEHEGEESASSTTDVEASLDDIIAGGHAINVHESVENIQNYIACGEVTGTPTDGVLEIQLGELNESGYYGTATLTDNGDGTTTVEVEVEKEHGEGTPEASPAS